MKRATNRNCRGQCGYTMIELMIAITIALFLLAGLVTLVMGTRRSSATQSQLATLQDNERIAMTLMTNVIQQAGYYPNPTTLTNASFAAEASAAGAFAVGQPLAGAYSAVAPGDKIAARFISPQNDATTNNTIVNCAGTSNSTGSAMTYTNLFQVATVNGVPTLQCVLSQNGVVQAPVVNLVSGVQSISVMYGVSSSTAVDNNVITYENAAAANANPTDWTRVTAVKLRLTFQVPQYGSTGGQASSQTQYLERVIPIMGRAGINN
jgi:type IV pilus assembly protein PilW